MVARASVRLAPALWLWLRWLWRKLWCVELSARPILLRSFLRLLVHLEVIDLAPAPALALWLWLSLSLCRVSLMVRRSIVAIFGIVTAIVTDSANRIDNGLAVCSQLADSRVDSPCDDQIGDILDT